MYVTHFKGVKRDFLVIYHLFCTLFCLMVIYRHFIKQNKGIFIIIRYFYLIKIFKLCLLRIR